jgi:hypothetical protein
MNEVDHERMHDRPNMDVANRLSHYGWRLCSYEKGCQQSRRNQSGADEDAQGKRQNMSTKELRLVTYRICNDAVIYYTQDAAEYKKTAAELDTMLTCAEWMKWFGDQAFSYLMTTYYGNTADAILSPAKDLFAAFLGEVLDYLLHGESFTLEEPEIIKNITAGVDNLIVNAFDDSISSKKISFKQICTVAAGFLAWKIAKNVYENRDRDGKVDIYSAITALTAD